MRPVKRYLVVFSEDGVVSVRFTKGPVKKLKGQEILAVKMCSVNRLHAPMIDHLVSSGNEMELDGCTIDELFGEAMNIGRELQAKASNSVVLSLPR